MIGVITLSVNYVIIFEYLFRLIKIQFYSQLALVGWGVNLCSLGLAGKGHFSFHPLKDNFAQTIMTILLCLKFSLLQPADESNYNACLLHCHACYASVRDSNFFLLSTLVQTFYSKIGVVWSGWIQAPSILRCQSRLPANDSRVTSLLHVYWSMTDSFSGFEVSRYVLSLSVSIQFNDSIFLLWDHSAIWKFTLVWISRRILI